MSNDLASTAYHEAGHAVINYCLGLGSEEVTIVPNDSKGNLGHASGEGPWITDDIDAACIKRLFAGFAAQKRYNPEANIEQSSSDYEKADDLLAIHPELSKEELLKETEELVEKHWTEIEAVATALLEDKTLTGEEMEMICCSIEEHEDWRIQLDIFRQKQKFWERGIM